ncbi:MAG: tetratricopeptide repeat-containing sensor histidine kinase [Mangrovibacterium sp.]|nr:tetratricopeptide repeat-containing sensor histidine kinase [Mangrovibacterium sp.]
MKWSLFKLIILLTLSLAGTNLGAQPSKVDSLAGLLSGQEGEYLARTYLELARAWNYKDPAKMIDYAGKALAITHETGNLKQACYANLLLGSGNLLLGKFDESKPYIDLGLEQARKLNFPEYLCIGFNSLAAYYMNGGNYDLAFELFHEALNMAESANLPEMAANSRLNLGSILTSRGDRTDGLKYLLQALEYYESTGEQRMISRIYNNIAVNYHSWKDYDLALHYYARTLVSYEKQQDFVGLAVVSNNIGEIYKDKEEYAQAIRYYQRTIQLADSTGIGEFYKSYGWIGLAETYLLMGEHDLSLKNVTLALGVFGRTKMKEGIALSHLILSRIYLYKKDYPKSLQAADSAIQVGGAIGIPGIVGKAYQVKASVYADQKRYQEAFDMLNFALRKRDTLYKEEQVRELARLRGELDVTGKNKEIQLLLKDNEIKDLSLKKQRTQTRYLVLLIGLLIAIFIIMLINIRSNRRTRFLLQEKSQRINEQRLELIRVNATKDKFLSIIGHDLRNPVGAFKDVVGQLADFPEMFPEEMRQQIIRELRDEAERTYFLLENLLSWAKNQKNNIRYHPEKLDLASLVDNNILLHARSAERKQIRLRSSVLPGVAVYADHNMVNLILRNLISNAIKFTGENGEITVSSKDKEDFIEVSLADSGVGIPKERVPALFEEINSVSTYGTNHEKGSGIGLILCREFIEMNGGTITVRSKVNMGTTLTFTLKKHKTPVFAEP